MQILYASIVPLFFVVGLFNNACSFVTLKWPQPRKFAVGNYLLIVTVINQCALFFLLLKFTHVLLGLSGKLINDHLYMVNLVTCKGVSYLLSVCTRTTFWLTSWVTVDRLLITMFPALKISKNQYIAIGVSTATGYGQPSVTFGSEGSTFFS